MSSALTRGFALMNQGRLDLAEKAFRQALAEDPNEAVGHAFLSLCLNNRDQHVDALKSADEAIRLNPDSAFAHSVRAYALLGLKQLREAEASAYESIRLDPNSAESRVLLGQIAIARQKPTEALEAADRALQLDGQSVDARNIRALALTQLGRKKEAAQTLGEALAEDPEDPLSHANQGWVCLHANDHAKALDHFREALRLDPNMEWARIGIIEALKSRYLIYRLMLRFFLWIGRQTQIAQWAVILGIAFGPRILRGISETAPRLAPFLIPIQALLFGFVILTWIASPLFNFLLRFNKFGRLALSPEEKRESSWIGGCVVVALGCAIGYFATGSERALLGMIIFGLILLPLKITFTLPKGKTRMIGAAATVGLLLLNVPLLSLTLFHDAGPFRDKAQALNGFKYFIYGTALSSWLPMILRSRNSYR